MSLGINWGPVKADLVSTKEGLKILEMAPRLHGPKGTLFLTKMAKGTEHLSHIAPLLIGQDVDEEKFIKPQLYASFKLIVSPNIPFKVIHGAKEIREDGCEIMLFKKSSSRVIRYRNSSDAIGYVFAACEKYSDLEDKLNGALKKFTLNDCNHREFGMIENKIKNIVSREIKIDNISMGKNFPLVTFFWA